MVFLLSLELESNPQLPIPWGCKEFGHMEEPRGRPVTRYQQGKKKGQGSGRQTVSAHGHVAIWAGVGPAGRRFSPHAVSPQEMTADSLPGIRGHGSRYFNFVSVAGCRSEQRPRRPACRAHEVQPSRSPVGRPWRCHAVRTPAPKCPRKRLFCPPCWRGPRLSVVPLSSACRVKSRRKQGLLKTSSPLDPHFLV